VEARRRTWFDERGIADATRTLPFFGGAMHYWRVPRARWAACLAAMHDQGFTIVETPVPWRVHERQAGALDWTGDCDLAAFLDAAKAAGLAVVLRLGPSVNAELTSFGIPDWVLANPACQARTAHDTPAWVPAPPRAFPIPSYASADFHVHVRQWYRAVAEVVAQCLGAPVVAIGVDHEAQLFFRTGAYDLDYHPDALAWWREWSGVDDPPRAWDPADAKRCVQWVTFKDAYVSRALGDFSRMLDDVGLGEIARFHNLPPGHYGLYDLRRIQRATGGPVGIDAFTSRASFPELRRRAAATVGNAEPLPIAFGVGVGFFPWFPPLDAADDPARERDHLLTLLASGIRGFNLVMAVERDRYYGAAIDQDGKASASWVKPLLAALAELEWTTLRRETPIAVIDMRADARFGAASSAVDPITPVLADLLRLGPGGAAELALDTAAITARRWQTAVCRALELAQVPYAICDETASEDELAGYRAVIAPTSARIDRALWSRLRGLAEHKRAIVVIGPDTPTRDELDQPLPEPLPRRMGRLNAASLDDLAGLADDLAALAGELPDTWQVERPDDVRTSVFTSPDGSVRAIFVLSDADRPVTATLLADRDVRDALSNERFALRDGRVAVPLPPHGVRLLV
jgi:beta-galactosidase